MKNWIVIAGLILAVCMFQFAGSTSIVSANQNEITIASAEKTEDAPSTDTTAAPTTDTTAQPPAGEEEKKAE